MAFSESKCRDLDIEWVMSHHCDGFSISSDGPPRAFLFYSFFFGMALRHIKVKKEIRISFLLPLWKMHSWEKYLVLSAVPEKGFERSEPSAV